VKKKLYIKPEIEKIVIDNLISLQMASTDVPVQPQPQDPIVGGKGSNRPNSDPFASPFGDKPFN
jgi:hypothetical protein